MNTGETIETWSKKIASLAVDLLVENSIVKKENFECATRIVAEEIRDRIIFGDYPPKEEQHR